MNTLDKIGTKNTMPSPSPKLAASLRLRPETFAFPDELEAAWQGNGKQTYTLHQDAVKSAMREFWQAKRPNLIGSALDEFLAARHPLLFRPGQRQGISGTA